MLKIWNNSTNDIEPKYFNSNAITVANKRFDLSSAYEELKHRLDFWCERGSGWIVDTTENIWIKISIYDPFSGVSYIP